jgi:DNA-binding response OmpR family regulator
MARILLVDDEQDLVWAVQHGLNDEGHEILTAYDGLEALAIARRHRPDLVILDIVMPRLDGLQVSRRLRRDPTLAAVPILFLTVRSTIEDRVAGLDEGGDDYLVKPFDLGELKARVRALLRRVRMSRSSTPGHPADGPGPEDQDFLLVIGPLTLDLRSRQVRVREKPVQFSYLVAGTVSITDTLSRSSTPGQQGEKTVQLTPAEFDLLHHLMLHPGEVFSSTQLLRQVWGYPPETADPGLVRWHMRNLRAKIEPDPAHPLYLLTIPHHGYILATNATLT